MTQALASEQTVAQITGLLLALSDRLLLVPNTAVAELVAYRNVQPAENSPNWLLGQIAWRDLSLPLLALEAVENDTPVDLDSARVVIINAIGGRPKFRFFALLIKGIPRSVRIDDSLQRLSDEPLQALELDAVSIDGEVAKIPDLAGLEQKLADLELI